MFKHIGKDAADSGDLSDRIVGLTDDNVKMWLEIDRLADEQFIDGTRLDLLVKDVQDLKSTPAPTSTPIITHIGAPAEDHSRLYSAVADAQTDISTLQQKWQDLHVPDVLPIINKIGDLESRLRFNEKAVLDHGKETLKTAIEVLDARLTEHNALLAQSDMFRAKTIKDQDRKLTLLWRAVTGLSIALAAAYVYILL